jgi:PKD domain-containing protein
VRRAVTLASLAVIACLALAPAVTAAQPKADFTVAPATPTVGQAASYQAVLSPPNSLATFEWDFDGDPGVFEAAGASIAHVYLTPGEKQVTMRVFKEGKGKGGKINEVVTKTIYVNPVVAPAPTQPDARAPGSVDEARLLMIPFPIVRITGRLLPRGALVRLLVVTAPRGAVVTVRCRGTGCPFRPLRRRSHGRPVRIRGLERRLPARTRLEIFVRQRGLVGKYTRFRIRAGGRSPLRDDRCLLPGRRTPVSCSFG